MSHLEYGKQDLRLNEIDGVQIFNAKRFWKWETDGSNQVRLGTSWVCLDDEVRCTVKMLLNVKLAYMI